MPKLSLLTVFRDIQQKKVGERERESEKEGIKIRNFHQNLAALPASKIGLYVQGFGKRSRGYPF